MPKRGGGGGGSGGGGGGGAKKRGRRDGTDAAAAAAAPAGAASRRFQRHPPGILTVALSGARVGDVLVGVSDDTRGVQLELVEGVAYASRRHYKHLSPEEYVQLYVDAYGVSRDIARQLMNDRPRLDEDGVDNAMPVGAEPAADVPGKRRACAKFVVRQPGTFTAFAEAAGAAGAAELQAAVEAGTPVDFAFVLDRMGKKSLVLRAKLFAVVRGPREVCAVPPGTPQKLRVEATVPAAAAASTDATDGTAATTAAAGADADAAAAARPAERAGDAAAAGGGSRSKLDDGSGGGGGGREAAGVVVYEVPRRDAKAGTLFVTSHRARATPMPDAPHSEEATWELVKLAVPTATRRDVDLAHRSLQGKTGGVLKSALQKVVRFGAARVGVLDGQEEVSAPTYAAVAFMLLATGPGTFVPDLQLFTRGITAALKRTAVILVEDAWAGLPRDVEWLLGVALLCQRIPTYTPPDTVLVSGAHLVAAAVSSRRVMAWRPHARTPPAGCKELVGQTSHGHSLRRAALLLHELGSFKGDKAMLDTVAEWEARGQGRMWKLRKRGLGGAANALVAVVPEAHIYDQHVAGGIGHVLNDAGIRRAGAAPLATFRARYSLIFEGVTGTNPRLGTVRAEATPEVAAVRAAQRLHMALVTQAQATARPELLLLLRPDARPVALEPAREQEQVVGIPVASGVLAAGVGPVAVRVAAKLGHGKKAKRRQLVVLLGTVQPEAETVMVPPARGAVKRDLYDWGGSDDPEAQAKVEAEREAAREAVRSMKLRVTSPLLASCCHGGGGGDGRNGKGAGRTGAGRAQLVATFADGVWRVDGRPWSHIVARGLQRSVPVYAAPAWAAPLAAAAAAACSSNSRSSSSRGRASKFGQRLLHDDAAVWEAVRARGTGLVEGAAVHARRLCAAVPMSILLRALAAVRQQHERVALPVPARDGGLGSDQLMAYPNDWLVWRLLVLLGRLAPGALQPETPPRFKVRDAGLLQLLVRWMTDVRNGHAAGAEEEEGEGREREAACPADPSSSSSTVAGAAVPPAAAATTAASVRRSGGGGGGGGCGDGGGRADGGSKPALHFGFAARWVRKQYKKLLTHQQNAVDAILARESNGAAGHLVVMDTGLGKTLTAATALLKLLAQSPEYQRQVEYIIWATPSGGKARTLMKSLSAELTRWGLPHVEVKPAKRNAGGRPPAFKAGCFNLVAHDDMRLMPALPAVGMHSVVVFDEVDQLYNTTQRTSMALQLANACFRFIATTATPMTNKVSQLAMWLALMQDYPVTDRNYLVAASEMVAAKMALGIAREFSTELVPQTAAARRAFQTYLQSNGQSWSALADAIQDDTDAAMCTTAARLARADRAAHPTGGVLLVANSNRHADRLVGMLQGAAHRVTAALVGRIMDPGVAVVVVTKNNARGYNGAIRLGALVRGVYAGNGSQRLQMEGRICRIGQQRSRLDYVTVVMRDTMLHLLMERQRTVDAVNISLEQFARRYRAEVMQLPTTTSATTSAAAAPIDN